MFFLSFFSRFQAILTRPTDPPRAARSDFLGSETPSDRPNSAHTWNAECVPLSTFNFAPPLQPLAGRMRALEGDAEAEGRRQRQRVGAAPHDTPPSNAAVLRLGLAAAVAALQAHVAVARVAHVACVRIANLCLEAGNRQPAAEMGALEAVWWRRCGRTRRLQAQECGCWVCWATCTGIDAAALACKQRAAGAGALEVVVAAMVAGAPAGDERAAAGL